MQIDKSPDRSPLCIADVLKPIVKGRVFCDIGCRNGDLMNDVKKYAKEVIGIESNIERCKVCFDRGLNVINGAVKEDASNIPEADVYYVWINKTINEKIANSIKKGTVIVGGDPAAGEVYNIGGKLIKVYYNEGDGERQSGIFNLTVIEK